MATFTKLVLNRLNEIKQEIEIEEKEHEKRVEERKKQRALEAVQPKKKLGKRRYVT
jgi:hypothetical protein